MLLLSLFFSPALACDPIDWETHIVWPAEGEVVSADAAPFVHAWNTGYTVALSVSGPSGVVSGEQLQWDVDGWSDAFRFVPDAPLPAGEYTLVVDLPDLDRMPEVYAFEVLDDTPTLGAVSMRELDAVWMDFEPDGDMCDERSKHVVDLTWAVPDAAQMKLVALSVHVAASAEGPIDEAPLRVLTADRMSDQQTTVQVHTGDDARDICLAIKSWGVNPDEDDLSEIVCTDEAGAGPGEEGASGCTCSSTASPLSAAPLLGLLALVGRRRQRG